MEKPFEVQEGPNKPNVTYIVQCMQKDTEHEFYFEWLVEELKLKGTLCERTIIYCQTIRQCSILYGMIKGMLGMDICSGIDEDPSNALVEMLHSCTPPANKEKILLSFQSITGTIRLLIATIAFGMGVDWKGVLESFTMDLPKMWNPIFRKLGEQAGMVLKVLCKFYTMGSF